MNNKKQTQTAKKFQPKVKQPRNFKFWLSSIFYTFLFLKTIQLARFLMAFSYTIPKEQLKTNMVSFTNKDLNQMNPEVITKLLDELEQMKKKRKNNN